MVRDMSYEVREFLALWLIWFGGFCSAFFLMLVLKVARPDEKTKKCWDDLTDSYLEMEVMEIQEIHYDGIVNMVVVWNFWPYDWETQGV